jgi:hypothetical protein
MQQEWPGGAGQTNLQLQQYIVRVVGPIRRGTLPWNNWNHFSQYNHGCSSTRSLPAEPIQGTALCQRGHVPFYFGLR